MLAKLLRGDDSRKDQNSFFWNMAGSLLVAFQPVLYLMAITRISGISQAGIFTIANADAGMFLAIGKFGMRYFQVSDVGEKYSFRQYRASRRITCALMLAVSFLYVLIAGRVNGYSAEKSYVILVMCCYRTLDAAEDIWHGRYQQKGRLDVAGRCITIRYVLTTVSFPLFLLFGAGMPLALTGSAAVSLLLLILLTGSANRALEDVCGSADKGGQSEKHFVKDLLLGCAPIFGGTFLSIYITNAPKYAIDSLLNDELQAVYGFISMPVYVVSMLNGFILNPVLVDLSKLWNERKVSEFIQRVFLQILIVAGLTALCIAGAWVLGIPVLSWLYSTDLGDYKRELMILLLGGGFLGLSEVLNIMITIIRFQQSILVAYAIAAAAAFALSGYFVSRAGLLGASVLYCILMGILSLLFAVCLAIGIDKEKRSAKQSHDS